MYLTTSLDRYLTFLGIFCRDELRREGIEGSIAWDVADEKEYLARHAVPSESTGTFTGRVRFDELATRIRDYPSPLPANVVEKRAVFDELKRELKLIELDSERPEPEIWQKIDSLRARLQDNAIDCEFLPKNDQAEVEVRGVGGAAGDVAAPVAPVAPVKVTSPPWKKGLRGAVKECLLAYLKKCQLASLGLPGGDEFEFEKGDAYHTDPGKLALLVRKQIVIAMKSKKCPFVPPKGLWPVGRTAGKVMLITFDGDENPTKNGRKPRES
ncbi:MAG: hypothetical protein NT142_10125 [Planctomycetota bacterium]|nr:hypothetical protein [Planctomycetota bacterium]